MKRSFLRTVLCVVLLGCGSDPPPDTAPPDAAPPDTAPPEIQTGLGVDPIPPDFTFQATRPVGVEIATATGGGSGAGPRAQLEIRTPSGDLIFRGSIVLGEAFRFDFPLAPDTTSLAFTMIDDSGVSISQVVAVDPSQPGVSVVLGGAP